MSADMSDDDAGPLSMSDWQMQDVPSPAGSDKSDVDDETTGPSQPIQKRRRVTRACDECRRKKIKCDGKQPCTHCSVYSYECTYDKPSNRRRNPAPQYIEALESRLQRAEGLLRKFMPDIDLADPGLDPAVQQEFHNREQARARAAGLSSLRVKQAPEAESNDAHLMSMIDSIGQLDIDEKGDWDFHGISSGVVFLRRMKENFRGMLGPPSKVPFLPRPNDPDGLSMLDVPSPGGMSNYSFGSNGPELPPKDVARHLCYLSLSCATCLVRVVHVPSFYAKVDRMYEKPLDNLSHDDTHFLGLFFAVLALGCMYNNLDGSVPDRGNYKSAIDEGLKYHKISRAILQDVTDCRDLTTIQALLFMILFMQATANLSACYAFVGIALRSALRIGLHRHLRHENIGAIEQETRSRVFYVIRQMDIYVSTLLGFPLLLHADDIDQSYPTEVDDQYITPGGIIQPPLGTPSFFEAFNAHTRLMEILAKVTKYVYPMKGLGQSVMKDNKPTSTYLIHYSRIKEIESDLREWYERLPETWRPSTDGPIEVVRVRHLLRFTYAHVQLVLYRPFLHYVSPRLNQGTKLDELAYACAAAAISVSRNIVHIGIEIRRQQVLSGPFWFMLYTEFFAVLSLVFYAIENPEKPGSSEVLADARAGRQMIADLADKTLSADRVTSSLKVLFDQLPEKLDQGRSRSGTMKKRSGPVVKTPSSQGLHMQPQRPDDLMRSRSSLASMSFGTPTSRGSMDSMAHSDHTFTDTSFTASLQDIMPIDTSSRATPDSTSTRTSSTQVYGAQPMATPNPVNKLDSLMFPSEDPFAYPNQPMMELGFSGKEGISMSLGSQGSDSQYFAPVSMEEIEGQFLGQPPPYMMNQPQMMGMAGGMYDPSSMMSMPQVSPQPSQPAQPQPPQYRSQQQPPQQHGRRQPAPPQQAQPQPQQQRHSLAQILQSRRAKQHRNQERQIDQMFTQQGLQADFGSFFGSGRGGFQGM